MWQFGEKISELQQKAIAHAVATLVEVKGSAPQEVGAKIIVVKDGLDWGTIGGGKIEAHCIEHARQLLAKQLSSELKTWNLQKDIGMSCGGEVSVFFDIFTPAQWKIAIFGAGHISQELCRVLSGWQCQVTVFDSRKEWISKTIAAPNIKTVLLNSPDEGVTLLEETSFVLSMTKGHDCDFPVLRKILESHKNFPYLGVIGSNVKASKLKNELKALGAPKSFLNSIRCPVGIPIGKNTPSEIVISICAELIAARDKKTISVHTF